MKYKIGKYYIVKCTDSFFIVRINTNGRGKVILDTDKSNRKFGNGEIIPIDLFEGKEISKEDVMVEMI